MSVSSQIDMVGLQTIVVCFKGDQASGNIKEDWIEELYVFTF